MPVLLTDVVSQRLEGYPETGGFGENPRQEILNRVGQMSELPSGIIPLFPALKGIYRVLNSLPAGCVIALLPNIPSKKGITDPKAIQAIDTEQYWWEKATAYALGSGIQVGERLFVIQTEEYGLHVSGDHEFHVESRLIVTDKQVSLLIEKREPFRLQDQQSQKNPEAKELYIDKLTQKIELQYSVDFEGRPNSTTSIVISTYTDKEEIKCFYEVNSAKIPTRTITTVNGRPVRSLRELERLSMLTNSDLLIQKQVGLTGGRFDTEQVILDAITMSWWFSI